MAAKLRINSWLQFHLLLLVAGLWIRRYPSNSWRLSWKGLPLASSPWQKRSLGWSLLHLRFVQIPWELISLVVFVGNLTLVGGDRKLPESLVLVGWKWEQLMPYDQLGWWTCRLPPSCYLRNGAERLNCLIQNLREMRGIIDNSSRINAFLNLCVTFWIFMYFFSEDRIQTFKPKQKAPLFFVIPKMSKFRNCEKPLTSTILCIYQNPLKFFRTLFLTLL